MKLVRIKVDSPVSWDMKKIRLFGMVRRRLQLIAAVRDSTTAKVYHEDH